MCSPVGHGLIGLAVAQFVKMETPSSRLTTWLFVLVSSVAADFDFLPGLITGDVNFWHRGPTHSLLAAFVWGVVTYGVLRFFTTKAWLIAVAGGLAYASHIGLDLMNSDTRAPFGIPLWWPFVDSYSIIEPPVFGGFRHGVPGDDLATVFGAVFSRHNLGVVGREIVVTLPILLLAIGAAKLFRRSVD